MDPLTVDDLDGVSEGQKYPDGTVVRVFCMRTDRGDTNMDGPPSSTTARQSHPHPIRLATARFVGISKIGCFRQFVKTTTPFRDDNSHEDTKGHELHVAPVPESEIIEFSDMVELWERLWSKIPKPELEVK